MSCLQVGTTDVLCDLVRTKTFQDVSRFLVCCLLFCFLYVWCVCCVMSTIAVFILHVLSRTYAHTQVIKQYKPSAPERSKCNQIVQQEQSKSNHVARPERSKNNQAVRTERSESTLRCSTQTVHLSNQTVRTERAVRTV